jgi:hypothetical protein
VFMNTAMFEAPKFAVLDPEIVAVRVPVAVPTEYVADCTSEEAETLDGSGYAITLRGLDEPTKVPRDPSGLTARINRYIVPAFGKVHRAVESPPTLNAAEAHTKVGTGSVWLFDAYTTNVPAAFVSCPVVVIETEFCAVTYTVPAVYVKLVGLAYCVGRAVAAISRVPAAPAPLTLKKRRAVR